MVRVFVTYSIAAAAISCGLLLASDHIALQWTPDAQPIRLLSGELGYEHVDWSQRGLETSATAVDGLLCLQASNLERNRLGLTEPVQPNVRSRVTYTLAEPTAPQLSFSVLIGTRGQTRYIFNFAESWPESETMEVVAESDPDRRTVCDSVAHPVERAPRRLSFVALEYDSPFLRWQVDGETGECDLGPVLDEVLYQLSATSYSEYLLVDDFTLTSGVRDQRTRPTIREDFDFAPISLPVEARLEQFGGGAAVVIFTVAIFFLLAFAVEFVVTSVANRLRRLQLRREVLSFLIIPTQVVVWHMARSVMGLSIVLFFICVVCLCMISAGRLVRSPHSEEPRAGNWKPARWLYAVPWLLYLVYVVSAILTDAPDMKSGTTMAVVAFSMPIVAAAVFRIVERRNTSQLSMWLCLTPQLMLFHVLRLFHPGAAALPFLLQASAPWLLVTAVDAVRDHTRSTISRRSQLACSILCLFVVFEGTIRGNAWLNTFLDVDNQVDAWGWDVAETTNLFGDVTQHERRAFEGYTYPVRKPPGNFRVVCLGSSSTGGLGASSQSAVYPAVLEQRLQRRSSMNVEVINAGLGGAPLYPLKIYLEQVLLPLDPDLVVLYFGANGDTAWSRDLFAEIEREIEASPYIRSNAELWAARQLRWSPRWMVHSFLAASRTRMFVGLVMAINGDLDLTFGPVTPGSDEPCRVSMRRTTLEIVDLCAERRVPLVLIPEIEIENILEPERVNPVDDIFEAGARHRVDASVHYLDITDVYDAEKIGAYFIDTMHMNDEGYEYLAMVIELALDSLGLLPLPDGIGPTDASTR